MKNNEETKQATPSKREAFGERIKKLSKEVAIVKMADRLFNIRSRAKMWSKEKQEKYKLEAQYICNELGYCSENLKKVLQQAIDVY